MAAGLGTGFLPGRQISSRFRQGFAEKGEVNKNMLPVFGTVTGRCSQGVSYAVYACNKNEEMKSVVKTKIIKINAEKPEEAYLREAAAILRQGGLVAFPTETVYGLGAAVIHPQAVQRVYSVKGRPADNPLIVHLDSYEQLPAVAVEIPPIARQLAGKFWPGPLTMVLPKKATIPEEVSAGLPTVAVRVPAHPVALRLLALAGVPVAAPSANLSGRPSPTQGSHVAEDLDGLVEMILDAGPTGVGVESTVLDLTGKPRGSPPRRGYPGDA